MNQTPLRYKESLNTDERLFLKDKELKERKQLLKVIRTMLLLCFIIPFIFAWFRAFADDPDPFSYLYYFIGVIFLMLFSGIPTWIAYNASLRKLQMDIRRNFKIAELVRVTRKQYMKANNTFYFYLNSTIQLSIEVSPETYHTLAEGDELVIEYLPQTKYYLGYY